VFARILPSGRASSDTMTLSVLASFSRTLSTLIIHFPQGVEGMGLVLNAVHCFAFAVVASGRKTCSASLSQARTRLKRLSVRF
jgi:hypothetical protein